MAAIMTFDSLSTEIVSWLEREGDTVLAANVPAIISDAEALIAREIKALAFQTSYSGELQPNTPILQKPSRWRATVSCTIKLPPQTVTEMGPQYAPAPPFTQSRALLPRSLEYCRQVWQNEASSDPYTPPLYYADLEFSNWYIAPTPAAAYPVNFLIWARPVPLDEKSQQNWLTLNAPDLMRSACMARASLYLKNPGTAANWKADYTMAINGLAAEDKRRLRDRATDVETVT